MRVTVSPDVVSSVSLTASSPPPIIIIPGQSGGEVMDDRLIVKYYRLTNSSKSSWTTEVRWSIKVDRENSDIIGGERHQSSLVMKESCDV